jgi:hypothetical protein
LSESADGSQWRPQVMRHRKRKSLQILVRHLKLGRARAHALFQSLIELPYVFFGLPASSDIASDAFDCNEAASLIEDRNVALLDPDDSAVSPHPPQGSLGQRRPLGTVFVETATIIGMNDPTDQIRIRVVLSGRVAGDRGHGRVDVRKTRLRYKLIAKHDVLRIVCQTTIALLCLAQSSNQQGVIQCSCSRTRQNAQNS